MEPEDRILDPIVALAFLATKTERMLLGAGIIILPQRNPLVLAKQLASLDELSSGRLLFGTDVGYLEPEFNALGVPFARCGARANEYLEAMLAIWTQEKPAYQGKYVSFSGVQAQPQRDVKIVVGGHSQAAYRRALKYGQGWYGFGMNVAQTRHALAAIRSAAAKVERPARLGELEISITPHGQITTEDVAQYAALGVDRLILMPPRNLVVRQLENYVKTMGDSLITQ